jgi:hypothetical protein
MTINGEINDQVDVNLHQSEQHRDTFAEARRLESEAVDAGMPRRLSRVPSGAVVDEMPAVIAAELTDLKQIATLGAAPNDLLRYTTHRPREEEGYSF